VLAAVAAVASAPASAQDIAASFLKLKTGMPGVAIPYKSTNEMMVSVASGQTLLAIGDGRQGRQPEV
jgi:tripartite-type tricarboxylate transporter receptor subunit TctC